MKEGEGRRRREEEGGGGARVVHPSADWGRRRRL